MPHDNEERRPRREAASNVTGKGDNVSLTALDEIARHVDGTFVLVVKVSGGRYRRRCFLTAASAQRAADRAIERGESATVYLAELRPLWRLEGGSLHTSREAHVCSVECARTHGGVA